MERGDVTPATVAHHIVPHKGDWQLFISGLLRSVCKHCHDSIEKGIEDRGYSNEIGSDGYPTDAAHPFNKKNKYSKNDGGGAKKL